jgi:hypothetical protein
MSNAFLKTHLIYRYLSRYIPKLIFSDNLKNTVNNKITKVNNCCFQNMVVPTYQDGKTDEFFNLNVEPEEDVIDTRKAGNCGCMPNI